MMREIHVCLDIRGFIRSTPYPKGYGNMFVRKDGTPLSPSEAREHLLDHLSMGHKVIPCSPCDNFSYETGCGGHVVEEHAGAATPRQPDPDKMERQ